LAIPYFNSDANHENQRDPWNDETRSKHQNQMASFFPSKLPARAHLPSCAGTHNFAQISVVIYLHIMFLMAIVFS
jgi:hypothetical protein